MVYILLFSDLIQLTAYLVYGFCMGSELHFNHRNWRWGYMLGLSNIALCVMLEWTYMIVKTLQVIRKRHKGTVGFKDLNPLSTFNFDFRLSSPLQQLPYSWNVFSVLFWILRVRHFLIG